MTVFIAFIKPLTLPYTYPVFVFAYICPWLLQAVYEDADSDLLETSEEEEMEEEEDEEVDTTSQEESNDEQSDSDDSGHGKRKSHTARWMSLPLKGSEPVISTIILPLCHQYGSSVYSNLIINK